MQHSGIHSIRVGDITVTALNDGQFQASTAIVNGVAEDQAAAAEAAAFRVLPPRITISSYLLEIGGRKVLVDTGCGTAFGPAMGRARGKLDTLGIKPADIAAVLVTHAHVDHVSGLVDGDGKPWYPTPRSSSTAWRARSGSTTPTPPPRRRPRRATSPSPRARCAPTPRAPAPSRTGRRGCPASPATTCPATRPAIPAG